MNSNEMKNGGKPHLLIIKTGAAGDVIRTTPLLHLFSEWTIDWFVSKENRTLLDTKKINHIFVDHSELEGLKLIYELVICLEDDEKLLQPIFSHVQFRRIFGSFPDANGFLTYSEDSRRWFDMSLISRFGIEYANREKIENRKSYQEILFQGLGATFGGEPYLLPSRIQRSDLGGDIAIAPNAGERWPMKNWFYYQELIYLLSKQYRVNVLPIRRTLTEHVADIANHKFVISNDSLPMHVALALNLPCVAFFICTSPWEIYDYGKLTKLVSPNLSEYFYIREENEVASKSISLDSAFEVIMNRLKSYGVR